MKVGVRFGIEGWDKNKNERAITVTPELDLHPKFSQDDYDKGVGIYYANQFFKATDGLIEDFAKRKGFKDTEDMLRFVGKKFIEKNTKEFINTITYTTVRLEQLGFMQSAKTKEK